MHLHPDLFGTLAQEPTRNGFGKGVVEAGKKDPRIVVICADLKESTRCEEFANMFPERFVEVGVAEQHMASLAAGMALAGKVPFIASYAAFSPGRNNEQIRTTIAINEANVKIVGAHAGVSVGADGATHQALEDIALMRVLPRMTVISPCDAVEAVKATVEAAYMEGPVYIRFARAGTPVFTTEQTPFEIGKAQVFWKGTDATVIATGPLVYEALCAARILMKKGISVEVVNCATIKPLDEKTILQSGKKTGAVVTVEEHQRAGGLGGAVAELLGERLPLPLERIGVNDRFGESGGVDELWNAFGLTRTHIAKAVEKVIKRKQG